MTNQNYTHLSIILDASGSMSTIKTDVIGNFNDFLKKQKEVEGKCTFSLYEFSSGRPDIVKTKRLTRNLCGYLSPKTAPWYQNHQVITSWGSVSGQTVAIEDTTDQFSISQANVPIKKAEKLTDKTYVPNGWTPLLDSIGRAVFETGEFLQSLPRDQRPAKVLFVVMTDGAENASKEYSKDDVAKVVKHQSEKYGWDFIFLGANMDAISVGQSFGFQMNQSVNFAATSASMGGTYSTLNEKVTNYRNSNDLVTAKAFMNYTVADRDATLNGVGGVSFTTTTTVANTGIPGAATTSNHKDDGDVKVTA